MPDRDANHIVVAKAITDDANETVTPLIMDAATDRLLIEVTPVSDDSGVTPTASILKRDANHVTVLGGITDDGSEIVYPLIIDNRNGLLYVDLEIE